MVGNYPQRSTDAKKHLTQEVVVVWFFYRDRIFARAAARQVSFVPVQSNSFGPD